MSPQKHTRTLYGFASPAQSLLHQARHQEFMGFGILKQLIPIPVNLAILMFVRTNSLKFAASSKHKTGKLHGVVV